MRDNISKMNLFFLSRNPREAAQAHCNRHVVKMVLETAQLLSTAHRVADGRLLVRLSPNKQCQSHAANKALGTIFMHMFVH
jgi:hypothetical protein